MAAEHDDIVGCGARIRLRRQLAYYTGASRTADVVAETPCVVLRCSREQVARLETDDPVVAIALHRWMARTIAGRLSDATRTLDALLD